MNGRSLAYNIPLDNLLTLHEAIHIFINLLLIYDL